MAEEEVENLKPNRKKTKPKVGNEDEPLRTSSSKMKLDQLLREVVAQSTKDANDAKKKNMSQEAEVKFESLRKAEGIQELYKEKDTAIIANTYDPDDGSKGQKSNKQRQKHKNKNKNAKLEEMKQNIEVQDEISTAEKRKTKIKKEYDFPDDKIEKELALATKMQILEKPSRKPRSGARKMVKSLVPQRDHIQLQEVKEEETTAVVIPKKKKKQKSKEDHLPENTGKKDAIKKKKTKQSIEEDEISEQEEEAKCDFTKKSVSEQKNNKSNIPENEMKEENKNSNKVLKKASAVEEVEVAGKEQAEENEEVAISKPKTKKKRKKQSEDEKADLVAEEEKEEISLTKSKATKTKHSRPEVKEEDEDKKAATKEEKIEALQAKPRKKKRVKDEDEAKSEKTDKKSQERTADEEDSIVDKNKKPKKGKSSEENEANSNIGKTSESPPEIADCGEVLALMIHRTDKLKNDFRILHPVVRVHVINEETGEYILKQHMDRAVTSYFETSNETVKHILPMMTQPFDFKERKCTIPVWEDLLVFNENFNYFVQPNPKVILLFELLDFVSMNTAKRQFTDQKEEGGWHRIAWAFLKVLGKNEKINVGNKMRLQLFVPVNKTQRVPGQPEVYQWWKSGQRTPYDSTLYVTLKSMNPPQEVSGAMRSMFATQEELSHMTYRDLKSMNWSGRERAQVKGRTLTTWTRLLGQLCRITNSLFLTLTAGTKGCFVIKFSNDGRSLACGCQNGTDYPILIYEIPSGNLKGQFQGHFGIVYSLSWNKSDTKLISASNDGTARVWDLQNLGENQERLLPHPGFVYTAEFHPRVDCIVVTGGYDEVVRVWDISISQDYNVLQQEIEEHHGHINCICFDTDDGQKMYSADSVGTILIWNVYVSDQASRKHFVRDWTKYQEIKDPELANTPINYIKMHPSGRRLLVHGRNNAIYMFDLRVQRVMQKYFGAENLKEKICSTITPCGSFIFSGSEDGKVYAWNTDTGDQVAVYTQLNYLMPVTDVHYHPRDHILAICSLGNNHPVYVYKYDPLIAQVDASSPRPASPVETTNVMDLENARMSAIKEMDLLSARSKVLTKEEFETQEKARYHRVLKKLENATMQMSQMPGMVVPESMFSPRLDTIGHSGIQSTWKMQYDTQYTLTPRSAAIPPGVLSPHAPAGSGTQLATQLSSHRGYMKFAAGDWRPSFLEMGRHGQRSHSPTVYGRPPNISLSTSVGKPQFTFESALGKTVKHKQVFALYDYRAQRSDELNIFKGDVITVLYKDNENWWMGELQNGEQGFFPANYVTEDEDSNAYRKSSKPPSVSSSSTVTAVKTKSGELKFVSGGEESDTEVPRTQKKKAGQEDRITSLTPDSPAKQLDDSIQALLDQYESVA